MTCRTFGGLRVVTDVNLVEPGEPAVVRRPWRERLFTRPWRPWVPTKLVPTMVPRKDVLVVGNMALMHPARLNQLMVAAEKEGWGVTHRA